MKKEFLNGKIYRSDITMQYADTLTDVEKILLVNGTPKNIQYITNPAPEVQLAATEIVGLILERCIAKNDMRDAIKLVTSGRINYDDLDDSKKLLVELTGI